VTLQRNLSRREFVAASGAGAVSILAPQSITQALAASRADRSRLIGSGTFAQGVMSGDPSPSGITLMSLLDGTEAAGQVLLEVATDPGFRKVIATRRINTSAANGHSVKARVTGLKAGRRFYYRFETKNAESRVGRFQTAFPADSNEKVRFAFFSCQEFTIGYYNAHRLLAREDVDFVINLGDYIYSDVGLSTPIAVRNGDFGPKFAATTLEEYRNRYRVYRSDPDLRNMHAKFPIISCWDDHEVQNNYAGGDPAGGAVTSGKTGEYAYTPARRNAGYRAFFDCLPHFRTGAPNRLYHKGSFGKLVDLFVLDERQYRAAQPCGDKEAPACADLNAPRTFLGAQQNAFLRSGLQHSKAAWKIIANEVVMMPLKTTAQNYDGFDAWQGYPVEREALLKVIEQNRIKDVVFVTGDYHAFIAGNVQTAAGRTVATEFVGGSVTSASDPETRSIVNKGAGRDVFPGYGTIDAPTMPASDINTRKAANPWYKELDFLHHGYVLCEASNTSFKATYQKLQTIRQKSTALASAKTYTVRRGRAGL
jgi:alkaline phosphatase D